MSICKELEELYPAYILDAVDEHDRARIEAHLRHCASCSQIVAEYQPVADSLAYSVPLFEPPAELKYRVLAAIPKSKPLARRAALGWFNLSFLANALRSPAFSAAMLLLLIGLGAWNFTLQNQITQQAAFNQQMTAEITRQRTLVSTVAYADTQPKRLQSTDAAPLAIGRLYLAPELNAIALIVYDMPVLDAKKVYQIWLIDPAGDRTSAGVFTVDDRGRGWVYVRSPKPLSQFQSVGITVEPEGGSPKPTGAKMMGTSL
jgi:anti-sigma-K factor RskA